MPSDKSLYRFIPPKTAEKLPILFESPHSGTYHPEHGEENIGKGLIYPGVDRYVDKLFDFAPEIGAPFLTAEFCRSYIDVNRALDDMRPEWFETPWPDTLNPSKKSTHGIGLVWPLKDGSNLSPEDVKQRIENYYTPYHKKLSETLLALKDQHGQAIHISCHSAPASIMKPEINPRIGYIADIVISDNFGQTADPKIGKTLKKLLEQKGYKVLSNDPFQGDALINNNGAPQNGIHSIQIEVNRNLYMDERSLKIKEKPFEHLQSNLKICFKSLAAQTSIYP